MKTYVYVDGFNLYYGALKGTAYKWLDLRALFPRILRPNHQIEKIKFFTARVKPPPWDPNNDSHVRQEVYLRALDASGGVDIIEGHYLTHPVKMPMVRPSHGRNPLCEVWKTEEKGSDVNLAVHLLDDAWAKRFECAVIVSNDSDLAESLRLATLARKVPYLLVTPGDPKLRRTNAQLARWARAKLRIKQPDLANSQFPSVITTPGRAPIRRPAAW